MLHQLEALRQLQVSRCCMLHQHCVNICSGINAADYWQQHVICAVACACAGDMSLILMDTIWQDSTAHWHSRNQRGQLPI